MARQAAVGVRSTSTPTACSSSSSSSIMEEAPVTVCSRRVLAAMPQTKPAAAVAAGVLATSRTDHPHRRRHPPPTRRGFPCGRVVAPERAMHLPHALPARAAVAAAAVVLVQGGSSSQPCRCACRLLEVPPGVGQPVAKGGVGRTRATRQRYRGSTVSTQARAYRLPTREVVCE